MRLIFFLLFPVFLSAQINRAYGVIEISSFPTSSTTGPKFAYRTVDSSFYRWVSGSTWVKVIPDGSSSGSDTLYLKQISGTTALVNGDTIDISTYLLHSDTSSMLTPYIKLAGYGLSKLVGHTLQVDTSVISTKTYTNRFLLKSDTLSMLAKYIERGDTASMLLRYPSTTGFGFVDGGKTWSADSAKLATRYHVGANFFPLQGGTLTGTGGAGFVGFPSQVSAPGTPASGLNVYAQGSSFNWKGTDGYERQFASILTGGRTYTLPDVSGTFALGTGTVDRSARWSATNTLAAGNFTDNGAKLEALLPFQFKNYTTAALPTGVTRYTVWDDTKVGPAWYQGNRWAYGLEGTFNRGTSTYIPYFDANGQVKENSNLRFESDYRLILNHANYNNIIGRDAGKTTATGTFNNVMGGLAGNSLTSGQRNNLFGAASGFSLTSGSYNVMIGNSNGNSSTTASYDVFIGDQSGLNNTTGSNNVFIGREAGLSNTTGTENIAIGRNAGRASLTATGLIAIGYEAGLSNTVSGNLFIGEQAGRSNTTGTPNFFVGKDAGRSNTTGIFNFFLGTSAGFSNTTGSFNLFSGPNVGYSNTTGSNNIYIGRDAGNSATTASDNTFIGSGAGFTLMAGGNTLIGRQAGYYIKNGKNNTVIGFDAGNSGVALDTLGGDVNTLIGYQAGKNIKTDADRNIVIGNVDLPSATGDNQLTIGNAIFGTGLTGTGTTIAGKIGIKTATPFRDFEVNGEVRITDLTTDSPTGVVGADSDGDLGLVGLSGGLSMSGGTLSSTWLKPALQAGNVTIGALGNTLKFDSLENLLITSPNTTQLGGGGIFQKHWLTSSRSKYMERGLIYDSRGIIAPSGFPTFWNLISYNLGSGENYEWVNGITLDTNNIVFQHQLGGRYANSVNLFRSQRPASGTAYRDYARFIFQGSSSTENETAYTYHTVWSTSSNIANQLMSLRDGGKFLIASDSTFAFDPATDVLQLSQYGDGTKEAADLSKTQSNYIAGFATDGTVLNLERKRDTTIYINDADYDFSAVLTTAQVARRYNRIIFWMTTTGSAGSDSEITLHTPDASLMQVEYIIHSVDEAGGFSNKIVFGTNNAVDSTNGLVTNYFPAAGQGVHIRAGLRSAVYKYRYY